MPPKSSTKPPAPVAAYSPSSSTRSRQYLILYNGACFVLWTTITLRALSLIPVLLSHDQLHGLYTALFPLLKWSQTLALLEIVHAAVGLVRASPVTTALQVASRVVVVWGIMDMFPSIIITNNMFGRDAPGPNGTVYAFAGCILAWGITEIIRYGFFVWKEGINPAIPAWLTWLRYNTFFVLYPIGISSEAWLIYNAIEPAKKNYPGLEWVFRGILLLYIPGSYILYTHMMKQRRKVLKGKQKQK